VRRRTVLAALGTAPVALAGCVALGSAGDCSFPEWPDDDSGADRPSGILGPTCPPASKTIECQEGPLNSTDYETAEPVAYPEPPATLTDSALVGYVEDFERAYVTHDTVCGHRESSSYVTDVFVSIHRTAVLDRHDERTAVFLLRSGGATAGIDPEAGRWERGAAPPEGVVYAIGDAGGDRVAFDTERLQAEEKEYRDPAEMDIETIARRAPDPVERGERVVVFE
jgi:hypothetical protein